MRDLFSEAPAWLKRQNSRRAAGYSGKRLRVVWVTNLQAPYREPVWAAFSSFADLTVLFLSGGTSGRSWEWQAREEYTSRVLPSWRIPGGRSLLVTYPRVPREINDADVVLLGGWDSPAYWQILWWARHLGKAVVAFYESTPGSQKFHGRHPIAWARRFFVGRAHAVLTGGIASTRAVESMGVPGNQIVTGFNTVDVEHFFDLASRARLAEWPSAGPGHTYIFVGRLIRLKGVDRMLHAFGRVARSSDRFLVVGEGPEQERLRAIAERVGRRPNAQIEFKGNLAPESLIRTMARANTLVLASDREVWGMVVNEALACGLHAVVAETCGCHDSVEWMPGVFSCATDVDSLSDALRASRDAWRGYIPSPPILRHDPRASALDAATACHLAYESKSLKHERAVK